MSKPAELNAHRLRSARLDGRNPTEFTLNPSAEARDWLARELELIALPALSFTGTIRAAGSTDWLLEARLKARVTQPCIVSLAPVTTALEEPVTRRFTPHLPEPEAEEVEMPEDDSLERLDPVIDLFIVMIEALRLALPQYPRAKGVEDPGHWGDEDEDDEAEAPAKPFAGLADLLARRDDKDQG